jgi:hypothetical protein
MKKERVGQFDVVRTKEGHRATCRYCHAASIGAYYEDLQEAVQLHVCGTPRMHTTTIPADLPHRPVDPAAPPPASPPPAVPRKLPAYLDLPTCPACQSPCGMMGEHFEMVCGSMVCVSCGTIWRGTEDEIQQAARAHLAWVSREDRRPGPYTAVVRRRAKRVTDRAQQSVLAIGQDPRFQRVP